MTCTVTAIGDKGVVHCQRVKCNFIASIAGAGHFTLAPFFPSLAIFFLSLQTTTHLNLIQFRCFFLVSKGLLNPERCQIQLDSNELNLLRRESLEFNRPSPSADDAGVVQVFWPRRNEILCSSPSHRTRRVIKRLLTRWPPSGRRLVASDRVSVAAITRRTPDFWFTTRKKNGVVSLNYFTNFPIKIQKFIHWT